MKAVISAQESMQFPVGHTTFRVLWISCWLEAADLGFKAPCLGLVDSLFCSEWTWAMRFHRLWWQPLFPVRAFCSQRRSFVHVEDGTSQKTDSKNCKGEPPACATTLPPHYPGGLHGSHQATSMPFPELLWRWGPTSHLPLQTLQQWSKSVFALDPEVHQNLSNPAIGVEESWCEMASISPLGGFYLPTMTRMRSLNLLVLTRQNSFSVQETFLSGGCLALQRGNVSL